MALDSNTMISPKLTVLMATMTLLGAGSPMLAAAEHIEIDIERNNEIRQNIEQEQEACTNEVEVSEEGRGDQEAFVVADQSNVCDVDQAQVGTNAAEINDASINDFDIQAFIAELTS